VAPLRALLAVVAAVLLARPGGRVEPPAPCLLPPVPAAVVDGFRSPWCLWCGGNRGLEYATAPGTPVHSGAAGTVLFASTVAGTRYVVVGHLSGLRTTYGRLATVSVVQGVRVRAGAVLGTSGSRLFFGVRGPRGRSGYLDPARYLLRPVGRPRLVPTDGSPGRQVAPGWPRHLTCTAREVAR
jgi:hypothetical protein